MATVSNTALARATAALERARQAEEAAKQAQAELEEAVNDRRLEVARLMVAEQVALEMDDAEFMAHMRELARAADAEDKRVAEEAARKRERARARRAKRREASVNTTQNASDASVGRHVTQGVTPPVSAGGTPDREGGR